MYDLRTQVKSPFKGPFTYDIGDDGVVTIYGARGGAVVVMNADLFNAIRSADIKIPNKEQPLPNAARILNEVVRSDYPDENGAVLFAIYDLVDRCLLSGRFDIIDEVLRSIDVASVGSTRLCGVLTITFRAKDHLKNRSDVYRRAMDVLTERHGDERAVEILRGLE